MNERSDLPAIVDEETHHPAPRSSLFASREGRGGRSVRGAAGAVGRA